MDELIVRVPVTLTRADLIRIIAQQLTMSWRHYPHTREECIERAIHYLQDVGADGLKSLKRLHNEFDETRSTPDPMEQVMAQHWARSRLIGPKFRRTATEIVDKHFPDFTDID